MPGLPHALLSNPLLAQAAGPGANATQPYWTYLPFAAIFVLWFYLLLIRPQQKQEQQRRALIHGLKKNDKVLTSSGIYGTVHSVDGNDDRVVLRVDDDKGVKVAFSKSSIVRVVSAPDGKEKTPKEKAAEGA